MQVRTWGLISRTGDAKKQLPPSAPKASIPPAKLGYGFFCPTHPVAASSRHPCSSHARADGAGEAPVGGDGCHRGPALLTGEHLAMPGEGLVQPWAGGGGAGSRVPVPIAASLLFCCPLMWSVQGKEQLGPCPGVIVHSSPTPI